MEHRASYPRSHSESTSRDFPRALYLDHNTSTEHVFLASVLSRPTELHLGLSWGTSGWKEPFGSYIDTLLDSRGVDPAYIMGSSVAYPPASSQAEPTPSSDAAEKMVSTESRAPARVPKYYPNQQGGVKRKAIDIPSPRASKKAAVDSGSSKPIPFPRFSRQGTSHKNPPAIVHVLSNNGSAKFNDSSALSVTDAGEIPDALSDAHSPIIFCGIDNCKHITSSIADMMRHRERPLHTGVVEPRSLQGLAPSSRRSPLSLDISDHRYDVDDRDVKLCLPVWGLQTDFQSKMSLPILQTLDIGTTNFRNLPDPVVDLIDPAQFHIHAFSEAPELHKVQLRDGIAPRNFTLPWAQLTHFCGSAAEPPCPTVSNFVLRNLGCAHSAYKTHRLLGFTRNLSRAHFHNVSLPSRAPVLVLYQWPILSPYTSIILLYNHPTTDPIDEPTPRAFPLPQGIVDCRFFQLNANVNSLNSSVPLPLRHDLHHLALYPADEALRDVVPLLTQLHLPLLESLELGEIHGQSHATFAAFLARSPKITSFTTPYDSDFLSPLGSPITYLDALPKPRHLDIQVYADHVDAVLRRLAQVPLFLPHIKSIKFVVVDGCVVDVRYPGSGTIQLRMRSGWSPFRSSGREELSLWGAHG
ncbi:hypothetical protein C8J57DRAFT_1732861 [Mycena rebaudengoi]|nr:hypothetical protein C8J57DRAFT_1732861 [Mycena rebaudengoi]